MLRAHKHWLPVILWMGFIFGLSTDLGSFEHTSRFIGPFLRWLNPEISAEAVRQVQFIIRKTGHFTEYAILALLVLRALRLSKPERSFLQTAFIALLVAAAYAATDEFHQSFVPSRGASVYDVLLDASGAFTALVVAALGRRRAD